MNEINTDNKCNNEDWFFKGLDHDNHEFKNKVSCVFKDNKTLKGGNEGISDILKESGSKITGFGKEILDSESTFLTGDTTQSSFAFANIFLFAMFMILTMTTNGMGHIMDCEFKKSIRSPLFVHTINILFLLVVIVYTSGHETTSPLEAFIITSLLYIWFLMITKLSGFYIMLLLGVIVVTFFVTHNQKHTRAEHQEILNTTKQEKDKMALHEKIHNETHFYNKIIVGLMIIMAILSFVGFGNHLISNKMISRNQSIYFNVKNTIKALFKFEQCK